MTQQTNHANGAKDHDGTAHTHDHEAPRGMGR